MTSVDVTAEEIEDAPLLMNPQVKEIKPETRSRLNLLLCIVLVINTLIQLVAIATPGWNILESEMTSTYESVYYTVVCVDLTPSENVSTTACSMVSDRRDFSVKYNAAKDTVKPSLVSLYNLRVRYQINIQLGWLVVAGVTIFQIIRYVRRNETYPKLTAINAMVLILACCAMYQALYEALVKLDLTLRESKHLAVVEVGFPYSLLLYGVAFIQTCVCTVVVLKQIYDYICHIEHALKETKVQVDTLQKQLEAEAEEFQHYRELFFDKTRLRGRSRKSRSSDRRLQRGDSRTSSQRWSERGKDHTDIIDRRNSQNRNDRRQKDLREVPVTHASISDTIERQIRDLDLLSQSGVSLDNISADNNLKDMPRNRRSLESLQLLKTPGLAQFIKELEQPKYPNVSTPTKTHIAEPNSHNELGDSKTANADPNSPRVRSIMEIVLADVHKPNMENIELK